MAQMTLKDLNQLLGREIPEAIFVIAKSVVMGMTPEQIATTMQLEREEVEGVLELDDFRDLRLLLGAERQKELVEIDSGWDGIESLAVERLYRSMKHESDPELLAKVAALANRAERRTRPKDAALLLDSTGATQRVPLTLTKRFTERLAAGGEVTERIEEQTVSILSGRMVNPTFDEVQKKLASG
jgi:hypothetical protein